MILIRDIFYLKYGKAKEAIAMWKEGQAILKKGGYNPDRILVDVTGKSYTLVLESTYSSLSDYDGRLQDTQAHEEWRKWYDKFLPLVESGNREIFRIVE
jgi:hypothetical protein